jgi:hypothetical protein
MNLEYNLSELILLAPVALVLLKYLSHRFP